MVNCDPPLREVLGESRVKLSGMLGKLQPHLGPPGPVKLEHRMRLSGPEIAAAACYDIQVDVPSPLQVRYRTSHPVHTRFTPGSRVSPPMW